MFMSPRGGVEPTMNKGLVHRDRDNSERGREREPGWHVTAAGVAATTSRSKTQPAAAVDDARHTPHPPPHPLPPPPPPTHHLMGGGDVGAATTVLFVDEASSPRYARPNPLARAQSECEQ